MKKYSNGTSEVTIGLDLGDRKSYFKVFDEAGELVEEGRIPTTSKALQKQFSSMPRARIALEVGRNQVGSVANCKAWDMK